MPDALAAATASRLQREAARAGVDVTWLETSVESDFALICRRLADAGLAWMTSAGRALPASLDAISLGGFEPEAWLPSSHPAAQQRAINAHELAGLTVVHGPRRASARTYDSWLAIMQVASPGFAFTDPPFRQSLLATLAFAAAASQPTAMLTSPRHPAGVHHAAGEDWNPPRYGMVPVRLDQSPLADHAALVWTEDLPRPLQQVLFDAADGLTLLTALSAFTGIRSCPSRLLPGATRSASTGILCPCYFSAAFPI